MTVFWILAAVTTALAGLLALAGARRGADASTEDSAALTARELDALDRLRDLGQMEPDAWAAARAEAGRRLLATETAAPVPASPRGERPALLAALGVAGVAAVALYAVTGSPGLPDQPWTRRVTEWSGRPETLTAPQLAAVAEQAVRDAPEDRQALTLLGAARFEAGDAIGAASAFRRALTLDPDDAQSWARLGESLTRANEGEVGSDAEAAFVEALRRDPRQLGARYFLGEAALARGDTAGVRLMWGPLIAVLEPNDPRRIDLVRRLPPAAATTP